jgi:hypothetical protein
VDELNSYLKQYGPLVNPCLLPSKSDDTQVRNRRKFLPSDDKFLLQGLKEFGYRDVSKIQKFWLLDKSESEIKHRYKNLTCAKAENNIIKQWKNEHKLPLNGEEKERLKEA